MTVYQIITDVGFYDRKPKAKGNKSARIKDVTGNIPKSMEEILTPPSPAGKNGKKSNDLQGEGKTFIKPSNIIDIWTKLEV